MSVIRLRSADSGRLVELADRILGAWRAYSDPEASIFAETDGEMHNTITPIARRRGEDFELDLVLRNNLTTEEHPLGLFHPHAELHHIKKENIGLIEVMGLAVLPARLRDELGELGRRLAAGEELTASPLTEKHAPWAEELTNEKTRSSPREKGAFFFVQTVNFPVSRGESLDKAEVGWYISTRKERVPTVGSVEC